MTAAYDALLASATPDFVVLVEVQPMEILQGWTAAGGGLTNTYYCSYSSQIATSAVAGGIYRRLDEVRHNANALTSRASAALVDANLGSYFFDTSTSRIYVSLSSGLSPDTAALVGAWFTLFFATKSVSFSDQPLYLPLVSGGLPTLVDEMADALFGSILSDSGAVELLNGDALFDKLSRAYVWRNKRVTFRHGGVGLAFTDFAIIDTLRINKIEVDDETATLQIETLSTILNKSLPLRTWGDGTVSGGPPAENPETGIFGTSQPLIFGTIENCPCVLGGRTPTDGFNPATDDWYAFDFNSGAYGNCQFVAVYAVERSTKTATLLTVGADYTTSGAVITVDNASYLYETHDIIATLSNIAFASSAKFGDMALAILRICGESDANIDTAAFSTVNADAPQTLARYVGEPVQAVDLLTELCQSVGGQVYRGADGKWTIRVITPDIPSTLVDLKDEDFVSWNPTGQLDAALNEVRVRYGHTPLDDSWLEVSASNDTVLYAAETSDAHRIDTWLTTSDDATGRAQHARLFKSTPPMQIEAEDRGLALMSAHAGDLVSVTRARAPVARTGTYDGHILRIVKLEKALGPDMPTVLVTLEDLGGHVDRIFRLLPSSSTLTWTTASAQEKARYGFLGDTNRYINSVKDQKVLW